jgi:hypothetical protein
VLTDYGMQIQRKSFKRNLAKDYLDDYYSSAGFYETGVDEFGFLNNLFHGQGNISCARKQGTESCIYERCILLILVCKSSITL